MGVLLMKRIRTFRKGAYIRYVGTDPRMIELWGNSTQKVEKKHGDMVSGYFPAYVCGARHCISYSVPTKDLEIVAR